MTRSYLVNVYQAIVIHDAHAEFGSVRLDEGEYTLVEIDNPTSAPVPWLVLEGTGKGAAKTWWFDQQRDDLLDLEELPTAA